MALLLVDPGVDRTMIVRVAEQIGTHLKDEETWLYPVVERAWSRPPVKERELHAFIHVLLSRLLALQRNGAMRTVYLKDLAVAFSKHAALVERAALLSLDEATVPAVPAHGVARRRR